MISASRYFSLLLILVTNSALAEKYLDPLTTQAANEGMPSLMINDLLLDSKEILWLATDAGLVMYTKRGATLVHETPDELETLSQTSQGTFCLSSLKTAYIVSENQLKVVAKAAGESQVGPSAAIGEQCWFFMSDGNVLQVAPTGATQTIRPVALSGRVPLSVEAYKERIWIGTDDGLVLLTGDDLKEKVLLEGRRVTAVAGVGETIWAAADHLLTKVNESDLSTKFYDWKAGTVGGERVISQIHPAKDGIWLATDNGPGLLREGASFLELLPSHLTMNLMSDIIETSDGEILYIGLQGGGLNFFARMRQSVGLFAPAPELSTVQAICMEGDHLWLIDSLALKYFNLADGQYFATATIAAGSEELDIAQNWVSRLYCEGDELFLATDKNGLLKRSLKGTDSAAQVVMESEFPIWDIDKNGQSFLLATGGGGVVSFDRATGKSTPWANSETGLTSQYVLTTEVMLTGTFAIGTDLGVDIREDSGSTHNAFSTARPVVAILDTKKGLWAGTLGSGAYFLDRGNGGKVAQIGRAEGLTSLSVVALHEDERGRVWMATGDGLFVWDPASKQMDHVALESGGLRYVQGANWIDKSGRWWVGGFGGLNRFFPGKVEFKKKSTQVYIAKLLAGGTSRLTNAFGSKSIGELSHDRSDLQVELDAPPNESSAAVRYRIKGLSDWKLSTTGSIQYPAIPSGDYVFELADPDGGPLAQVSFTVLPPWWLSKIALSAYALALALGVGTTIVIFKARTARLRRELQLAVYKEEIALTAAVQQCLFPDTREAHGTAWELRAEYQSATECSGDWWTYESRENDVCIALVGDVTGHGAGPAMVTAAAATAFHVNTSGTLESRIDTMSAELRRAGRGKYMMTLTALAIMPRSNAIEILSAGGLPVFGLSRSKKKWVAHSVRGGALGGESTSIGAITLPTDDVAHLLLLTDGITEMRVPNGRMLGARGLVKLLDEIPPQAPIASHLAEKLTTLSGGVLDDDWTMISISIGGVGNNVYRA